ncbi:MAG: thioredoxin family protein [Terriglobia bacterium]
MVLTASTMLPLGTKAPNFSLPDVTNSNRTIHLDSFSGKKGLLVMFICTHCPYVKHVQTELSRLGRDYHQKDLGILAISSNDPVSHPDDDPERLREMAVRLGFVFPYCHDGTQEVAKAYTAACTPDFFLFDKEHRLVYRGQLDDSRPGNSEPIDGHSLRAAIDAVLEGKPVASEQRASLGCNIKWKKGNEPPYAR